MTLIPQIAYPGARTYAHLLTVRAYRAAYRSGEIARLLCTDRPTIPMHVLDMVHAATDSAETQQVWCAILDAFGAGLAGDDPLSDVSIAIHYD